MKIYKQENYWVLETGRTKHYNSSKEKMYYWAAYELIDMSLYHQSPPVLRIKSVANP